MILTNLWQISRSTVLPIDFEALTLVTSLPFHHRDPFDRLMIAQALTQDMPIVSRDELFSAYQVKCIWTLS